jgi:hypothetical protein
MTPVEVSKLPVFFTNSINDSYPQFGVKPYTYV